jgi:hypothetical protein
VSKYYQISPQDIGLFTDTGLGRILLCILANIYSISFVSFCNGDIGLALLTEVLLHLRGRHLSLVHGILRILETSRD